MRAKRARPWALNPRSVRFRAFVLVLLVSLSPILLIVFSHVFEGGALDRMRGRTDKATAAACALAALPKPTKAFPRLRNIAEQQSVWLRVLTGQEIVFDTDHDSDNLVWLQALFYGADGAPNIREVDANLASLETRNFRLLTGEATCQSHAQDLLVVCHSVRHCEISGQMSVVHASASTRRSIRALYDMRYQILKLTAWILPLSLLLSLWLGWRVVRPIEHLVLNLEEVRRGRASASSIALDRQDEVGDLSRVAASAFVDLEEQRRQNEVFVTDLVHEFKSPVSAILSATETLENRDDERSQKLAAIFAQSGRRLDVLLSEFLSLARAEAGFAAEPWQVHDLQELLQNILEESAFEQADITLVSARVRCVPFRLESAVRGLLDNALSFGHRPIQVSMTVNEGAVALQIRDFGPGIPPDALDRVFERFYTTRGEKRGTGLGLALVLAVAQAHGGSISAENAEGGGARFTLRLPIA